MLKRKEHVIETALHLFLESGFQGTSIQSIIDKSGISKGTFYNYFQSKNDLLYGIITLIYEKVIEERQRMERDTTLSGKELFIKQVISFGALSKKFNLFPLLEEVHISDDPALKTFLQEHIFYEIAWVQRRLIELFGEDKRAVSLDGAVMFQGMVHQFMRFNKFINPNNERTYEAVVIYTVNRVGEIMTLLADQNDTIFLDAELLNEWLKKKSKQPLHQKRQFQEAHQSLKKAVIQYESDPNTLENLLQGLDFIENEFITQSDPRSFVIESILLSFTARSGKWKTELDRYKQKVEQLMR